MFRKLNKEANKGIEVDNSLKESTVNKLLNIKGSKKSF
jgi:hypothetical protein